MASAPWDPGGPYGGLPGANVGESVYGGMLEGEVLGNRMAVDRQNTQLRALEAVIRQAELQRHLQMLANPPLHFSTTNGTVVGVHPLTGQVVTNYSVPMDPTMQNLREQQAQLAEARAERQRILGEGKQLDPHRAMAWEAFQQQYPGRSYLDFFHEIERKTGLPQMLTLPVREQLMGMGIDPNTATPDEITAARGVVDQRTRPPQSLDTLLITANDPRATPEDRQRARDAIAAITGQRTQQTETTAGIQDTYAEQREKRKEEAAQRKLDEKQEKGFAATYTLLNQLEKLIPDMEKKGFLASNSGVPANALAAAKRSRFIPGIGQPGDPDLAAWNAHSGTMVAIQRQLGDIGPRAIAAYQSAIDIIDHPTTAAGARKAFAQLREAMDAAKTGEVQPGTGTAPSTPIPQMRRPGAAGPGGAVGGSAPQPQTFPTLPDPSTMKGDTIQDVKTGERFKSDGFKWDRVGGGTGPSSVTKPPDNDPLGIRTPQPQTQSGRRVAVAPDGRRGFLPAGTDISKYPGWKWAE